MNRPHSLFQWTIAIAAMALCLHPAQAQQLAEAALPDAPPAQPQPQTGNTAAPSQNYGQTKRILGVFPNFRAVSTTDHLPPQSVKEKFVDASEDSWDYSAFVLPAVLAGEQDATRATPEFGHGGIALGRYMWHSFVDQTEENYMVEFIFPTVTHEDTRYYTMGPGHGKKRLGYALSRIVITRNDAGNETFNISEVIGAGAGAGISNLYYPSKERTVSSTMSKWAVNIGVDATGFVIREFWPDINRKLFRGTQPD